MGGGDRDRRSNDLEVEGEEEEEEEKEEREELKEAVTKSVEENAYRRNFKMDKTEREEMMAIEGEMRGKKKAVVREVEEEREEEDEEEEEEETEKWVGNDDKAKRKKNELLNRVSRKPVFSLTKDKLKVKRKEKDNQVNEGRDKEGRRRDEERGGRERRRIRIRRGGEGGRGGGRKEFGM